MYRIHFAACCLFIFLIANFLTVAHREDVSEFYVPAAQMIARGESPYAINDGERVFLYPPVALIAFLPLAFIGPAYGVVLLLSVASLLYMIRAQKASWVWLLYPPALMALSIGQAELIVLALGLFAYRHRDRPWSDVLMVAICLFKPHVALFWMIPFAAAKTRQTAAMARYGGVMLIAVCASLLLTPGWWGEWWSSMGQNAAYYQLRSQSLVASGLTVLAVCLIPLLILLARRERWARVLYALVAPFTSYYAGAGLIGVAPGAFVGLSWLLAGVALVAHVQLFWIEPIAMLVWLAWPVIKPAFLLFKSDRSTMLKLQINVNARAVNTGGGE